MVVRSALEGQSQQSPDRFALLSPGREPITYSRLLTHCYRVLADLNHAGISRGDRVAVVLPNGPEMAACFLAVAMGASCAPLNPTYREREYEFYISDLAARALIVEEGADSPAIAVAKSLGIRVIRLRPSTNDAAGMFSLDIDTAPASASPVFAEDGDEALVLHTSGTTARPKMVPLTQANLAASARSIAASLKLRASDRCLNVMPLFHIHGLVGALLATIASGGSVACAPGFQAPRFLDWCDEFAPTWYTAVPTMHLAVLARVTDNPARVANAGLRFIRSCSAPLSPDLMAEMERAFGVPVIEAYGMTEASHQIASNPLPPGKRKPGSVGVAAGAEVVVMDEAGGMVATGQIGELVLRGPGVTAGYAENPDANRAAFFDGWFRTGDQGMLDPEGYVFITGRTKEMINRGGQKISPREIDEAVGSHPAVAQAVAFSIPDRRLGEDVGAAVVLRAGYSASEHELRMHTAERVADYKVPRRIVFLDEIPKGPTGKLRRIGLAEQLGISGDTASATERPTEFVAPRTPTEKALAEIWEHVLGSKRIGVNDDFLDLGGDSVLAALVLARVREVSDADLTFLAFFEHPTIAGVAQLIDSGAGKRSGAIEPITAASAGGDLPLSSAQRRMWFLSELDENSTAYNRCNLYRIRGPLDPTTLERGLNEIVARHTVLRTTFHNRDGEPVQVVSPPGAIALLQQDVSGVAEAERLNRALEIVLDAANRKFDLTRDAMLRPLLIKLGANDHLLGLTTHHIVSDGWSAGVIMRELSELYGAQVADGTDTASRRSPKPLSIQYADFAAWQLRSASGASARESLEWWKRRLTGAPPLLALATDRPRPPHQTYRGAAETFVIEGETLARLKQLGRQERATLFMTLLAAFQTLLHRYTGSADIVIGTPVAGRSRIETEGMVGLFVNWLALRGDLSGDPSFRDLLKLTRDSSLEAYTRQDLPFDMVVEALHPERSPSLQPIFQVTFQVRNYPLEDSPIADLSVEEIDFDHGISQLDISFEVTEKAGRLFCKLIYSTDLFERETIARMAGHFATLLSGVADDPEWRISRMPMLTRREHEQALVECNSNRSDPTSECVHRMFERQVDRSADKVALTAGGRSLTYRELNTRANEIANALISAGTRPGALVGLLIDRSTDMVAAMVGALKAGAAYVPLDPEFPRERIEFMMKDSAAPVLLTTRKLANEIPTDNVRTILLDETHYPSPESNPDVGVNLDGPAYVIYTSGSTGKPKGVVITHRNLASLLSAMCSEVGFTADDTLLAVTTLSFDIVELEILGPLISGGRLVVADAGVARDGASLASAIASNKINLMQATPTTWRLLMDAGWRGDPKLRILCGGEAMPRALADQLLDRAATVWNAYGPTETTIYSMIHRVEPGSGSVPIGRPLANTRVHVLDAEQQLVPIGVPGELYIGGEGVAQGYLNRPELTAERFVLDPFASEPGARLYRTGDRARRLRNGEFEFLGRVDDQLKVRGFRIEPGEIEAALARHPDLQGAAVVGRDDGAGSTTLVAYVLPRLGSTLSPAALRSFLGESLPPYMIPSQFVSVEEIPLTPNGKIDRAKLPEPDPTARSLHHEFIAPRNDMEARLQTIWEEILNARPIGVLDDFYQLGGHSLLAAKLLARIESKFNIRIPLAAMFPAPTIESIAARLGHAAKESEVPAAVPIQEHGSLPPLYVVGNFSLFRQLAFHLGADRPVIGLSIPDEERMQLPYNLKELAGLQVKSILDRNAGEPIFVIGFSAEGVLAYEVAVQLAAVGRPVGLLAMIDTTCPSQQREAWIVRLSRTLRIQSREVRNAGLKHLPTAFAELLDAALKLKPAGWKIRNRLGLFREPLTPKRPADLWKAMVLATRTYAPPSYEGRVLLFKQTVNREGRFRLGDYGWGGVIRNGPEICEISGDHFAFSLEPGVGTMAARLDAAMKSACDSAAEMKSAAAG